MSLFSQKNKEVFTAPLNLDNPIVAQVLGICSALAVTSQLEPAIVMGLSVTVITAFSNVIISLIRNTIPSRIRSRYDSEHVPQSLRLRCECAIVGLCRPDYHQLHSHGTS